jgi:hypothetical protein
MIAGCLVAVPVFGASLPVNLAPQARITASSEYNRQYRAAFVADGRIPEALGRQDVDQAWCVQGETHRQGAEITFQWPQPVTVGELVYHGRTAWMLTECWKDYEVRLPDQAAPLKTGRLQMTAGPQRISLPQPVLTDRLSLRFLSSHGGLNPGASEIRIFPRALTEEEGRQLAPTGEASLERVDAGRLAELIAELEQIHGVKYAAAARHRTELAALRQPQAAGAEVAEALARLQREVLLFDTDEAVVIARREINATHVYTYHNEDFNAGGGLYRVSLHRPEVPPVELAAAGAGQMLDCDVSHNGRTVLFSLRQSGTEGYHLWQVGSDGGGRKALTAGEWHDYNGCWLPDGGIVFVSTRQAQFAYCWNSPVGIVHRMNADGTQVRPLSANYLNDFTPYPLADGRILYSRWEYVDKPAIPIQSLWTINPDGTGLAGYFGNRVISPGTFMEARPIPGTTRIICTMTGHNGPARGAIGVIDRTRGVNAQEAIWNVTPEVRIPAAQDGNGNFEGAKPYSSPYPLDSARFLVSARGPVLVRDFTGKCVSVALAAPGDGRQYFGMQPLRPRATPPVTASRIDPDLAQRNRAVLYLQDVYNGLEPLVKRGEIKRLRIVHEMAKSVRIHPDKRAFGFQFPVISAGATYAAKDVLGEVAVEEDGSANFEVPAGLPIYFIALDAQGRALQRMRSFTHLAAGEVQGCVGCHEHRGSVVRATAQTLALRQAPQKIVPPEWGPGGFEYARVVQPVLDQHCASCHSGANAPQQVDLSGDTTDYFNVSYETLARGRRKAGEAQWDSPYVSWIPTYNGFETNILEIRPLAWGSPKSKLADLLLKNHPDAVGQPRIQLPEAARRRVLAWIDLNIPYYGSSETSNPESQGSRRVYPPALDQTLAEVAARRCAGCHEGGRIPRPFWTRITNPQLNRFLLAPLARAAGGTEACGRAVFASTSDPDYQAVLKTFTPALKEMAERPRMDMAGARPDLGVNRSCK